MYSIAGARAFFAKVCAAAELLGLALAPTVYLKYLWIRIHFLRIRIQLIFSKNADPDPA